MVSVFDSANLFTGFIDPNSIAVTPQNTDRAYFLNTPGVSPNPADTAAGLNPDQGPPVYTHGSILADGSAEIGGPVIFANMSTYTQGGAGNYSTIDCAAGNMHQMLITGNTNFTLNAKNLSVGQQVFVGFANQGNFTPNITLGTPIYELYSSGSPQSL